MKILFVLAILFAVAYAGRLSAEITYKGSADCSDATKIINIKVTPSENCSETTCESGSIFRCYDNITAVPIPTANVATSYGYTGENCTGEVSAEYRILGLAGCLTGDTSSYSPTCDTGALCSDSNCTTCITIEFELGTCHGTFKHSCGADKSAFLPATPASAPVSSPTGSAAPTSAPTGSSTPAKKSFASSLQVVFGASAAVLAAVALVV